MLSKQTKARIRANRVRREWPPEHRIQEAVSRACWNTPEAIVSTKHHPLGNNLRITPAMQLEVDRRVAEATQRYEAFKRELETVRLDPFAPCITYSRRTMFGHIDKAPYTERLRQAKRWRNYDKYEAKLARRKARRARVVSIEVPEGGPDTWFNAIQTSDTPMMTAADLKKKANELTDGKFGEVFGAREDEAPDERFALDEPKESKDA